MNAAARAAHVQDDPRAPTGHAAAVTPGAVTANAEIFQISRKLRILTTCRCNRSTATDVDYADVRAVRSDRDDGGVGDMPALVKADGGDFRTSGNKRNDGSISDAAAVTEINRGEVGRPDGDGIDSGVSY